MKSLEQITKPSKQEQKIAYESYGSLVSAIGQIPPDETEVEIEIEETKEKIKIPTRALTLLGIVLKSMADGKPISIVPCAVEVTTQKAAEILGCSRPHLVKLLEEGKIGFAKVGKHRRIKIDDVINFKQKMKEQQKQNIIDIMNQDEEAGLYDS